MLVTGLVRAVLLQIVADVLQGLQQCLGLLRRNALHGAGSQQAAMLMQGGMQRLPGLGQVQVHAAAVLRIGAGFQQPGFFQAGNQPGELGLVAPGVLGEVALGITRMAAEIAQHLAFHMGQPQAIVPDCGKLARAVLMHQGVDGLENLLGGIVNIVDKVNFILHIR